MKTISCVFCEIEKKSFCVRNYSVTVDFTLSLADDISVLLTGVVSLIVQLQKKKMCFNLDLFESKDIMVYQ